MPTNPPSNRSTALLCPAPDAGPGRSSWSRTPPSPRRARHPLLAPAAPGTPHSVPGAWDAYFVDAHVHYPDGMVGRRRPTDCLLHHLPEARLDDAYATAVAAGSVRPRPERDDRGGHLLQPPQRDLPLRGARRRRPPGPHRGHAHGPGRAAREPPGRGPGPRRLRGAHRAMARPRRPSAAVLRDAPLRAGLHPRAAPGRRRPERPAWAAHADAPLREPGGDCRHT